MKLMNKYVSNNYNCYTYVNNLSYEINFIH